MKKGASLSVFILLSLFLFSFIPMISAQGPGDMPDTGIGGEDVAKIQKTIEDVQDISGLKSKAEQRIDAINQWLDDNVSWLKIIFAMRPEVSWIFALNFLLILFFLVNFRNIFVFFSSLSENIATIVGILLTIVVIQLQITVKSAIWLVNLFSQWWFKLIIIVGVIVLIALSTYFGKFGMKRRAMAAKQEEELGRIKLKGAAKVAEKMTEAAAD